MDKNLSRLYYIGEKANPDDAEVSVNMVTKFDVKDGNIHNADHVKYFEYPGAITFPLKTTYPGLLIGSGYSHPAFGEGDFQLGFFFDHTTGMPVIPGSSVKGVLKGVFPKPDFSFKQEKLEYIDSLLPQNKKGVVTHNNWEKIFFKGKPKGKKPVFLDAYLSEIPNDGNLFADDYITPHTGGIFKNPIPIRFLKIAPDVKITFQFLLYDYQSDGCNITGEEITRVFRDILLEFGIGAKRNVGYGNLVEH